jgi:hypothetical protein
MRKLLILFIVLSFSVSFTQTGKTTFTFVQMTDTHLGDPAGDAVINKAIDMINSLPFPVEFVVHTGDIINNKMTDKSFASNTMELFKKIKYPVYFLAGNHDILPWAVKACVDNYTNFFGPLAYEEDFHGVRFLFVYTEPLRGKVTIPGYDPLGWLTKALSKKPEMPVIILHHAPAVGDFYNNSMHDNWPPDSEKNWNLMLLMHTNISAVLCGHFHRDELHWTAGIPTYVCPPVVTYFGRQSCFRVFEYTGGRLSYRTVYQE